MQVTFLRLHSGNRPLQQLRLRSPWDVSSIHVNDKTWPVSGMALQIEIASVGIIAEAEQSASEPSNEFNM